MLRIRKDVTDGRAEISLEGRLDAVSYLDLEDELREVLPGVTELVLDFGGLEYLSSAGLRVLLSLQKTMSRRGRMVVRNVREPIMDLFAFTKFLDILTIE